MRTENQGSIKVDSLVYNYLSNRFLLFFYSRYKEKNMRKAFTMVEIIFVIVIIGILSAIAIPKLAANRDDATSSICAQEVGQLIHEIGNSYMDVGYNVFKDLSIKDISNVKTSVNSNEIGIFENTSRKVDTVGVTYYCQGEALVKLVGNLASNEYNLTVEDQSPSTPTALKAAKKLRAIHGMAAGATRLYKF